MSAAADQSARRLLHRREIVCSGYARSDGMFDIEGHLSDTKTDDVDLAFKWVPAGDPIHSMHLTMTVDRELVIQHIEARTEAGPTRWCSDITAAYASLQGLRVAAGFKNHVKARVGGRLGCTHLTDLLGSMATTAIQTMTHVWRDNALLRAVRHPEHEPVRPWVLDTCHVYRSDGPAVRILWPESHVPSRAPPASGE
jgi:Protein of unknown function (DUF2889)